MFITISLQFVQYIGICGGYRPPLNFWLQNFLVKIF